MESTAKPKKLKGVSYTKWGYIFILPFFIVYAVFQIVPLVTTVYYSFFQYFESGLSVVGPKFIGLKNYVDVIHGDLPKYFGNTVIMWILGFVPQIIISLILAAWFSDEHLRIHGKQFFKVVIYMPNLIMASAFAMLFFALFSDTGPVNSFLVDAHILKQPFRFLSSVGGTRGLVGLMNFLMWFGNTTILLMAAVMGISPSLFEAAEIDGCNHTQVFFKITLPMIRPILVYVLITSMLGGLQMYDVPQVLTNGKGSPDRTSTTVIMLLNNYLSINKNYGMAGTISVILFIVCAILCIFVYFSMNSDGQESAAKENRRKLKREQAVARYKQSKGGVKQ